MTQQEQTQQYERAYEKAMDTADTILHFRGAGALPTISSMKEFILNEQHTNGLDTEFCILTEDFVREADEWYDKEAEPDGEGTD